MNPAEWAYEWSPFSVIIGALSTAQYRPRNWHAKIGCDPIVGHCPIRGCVQASPASPVFEYFAVNAADSFANRIYLERRQKGIHQPITLLLRSIDFIFSLFFFFFFEYSFIYIYVSSNEERGYVSMIRELDSDPLSTDHFNFRTLTSSTFNPFAGAKLKNFESWDGMGKNRRLKSLLQLIIYKFSLDFSLFKRLEKLVCCSK